MEPDKILKEEDPLATQFFESYSRVTMLNPGLSRKETKALLQYAEERTIRLLRNMIILGIHNTSFCANI